MTTPNGGAAMPEQLALWELPERQESIMITRTLYEDLQRVHSVEHVYAWSYGYLNQTLNLLAEGLVTEEYLRRQGFQLYCATQARLEDLKAPSPDVSAAAVLVATNRLWATSNDAQKSAEAHHQKGDEVDRSQSAVTES